MAKKPKDGCQTFSQKKKLAVHPAETSRNQWPDESRITFEDLFHLEDIQRLQDEFAMATGVASIITHTDGRPITAPSNFCRLCNDIIRKTEKGQENCFKSDAAIGRFNPQGPIVQVCMSGGLWDAGAGIEVGGRHIANWLIGQVRDETQTDEKIVAYAKEIGASESEMIEAFHEVPAMSSDQFNNVAQVLFTLANQLSAIAYQNSIQQRIISENKSMVTALQQSEARLAEFNQLLSGILDHTHMMAVFLDTQFNFIWVNRAYADTCKHEPDFFPGKNHFDLYPNQENQAIFQQVVNTGEPFSVMEKPFEFPDQPERGVTYWDWSLTPLTGQNKKVTGLVFTLVEVTRRVQAEEEKRKMLKLAAEQSKHALIGQVASKMAHDFNNVLMGILGNSQLAAMDCHDERILKKLNLIVDFAERGRTITNNLIAYSRDQESKQVLFRIEEQIDLVLKMLKKELANVTITRTYQPGIPKILADPGMIQDALRHMILNSIHAMSTTENPILNLSVYTENDQVYFAIKDNGCGIPQEHINNIFTPSFTLKGSHDRTGAYKAGIKGTGYGMANVKKYIVEKHKGEISVTSKVGSGTQVTVALQITRNDLSAREKKELAKNRIISSRKILLVEDETAIADVQYQVLTKEPFGHIVSTALNGQMAIDAFDRNEFDFISLDYMLPGNINGLDVYHHIRKKNTDIPILFISGNLEFLESIQQLKSEDPRLEHISKPVSNYEYVGFINQILETHAG